MLVAGGGWWWMVVGSSIVWSDPSFFIKELIVIINRSQDFRVHIFGQSGGNLTTLHFPKLNLNISRATCMFFYFTEFNKSTLLKIKSLPVAFKDIS